MERDYPTTGNGFSLLEAMVALAVAGIIAVVGIPGLTSMYLDNRRTSITNDFISALQVARSEAIKRNQRVVVCASDDQSVCGGSWSDGALIFADIDNDLERDKDETIVSTVGSSGGVAVSSEEFVSFLIYRPNGRAMAAEVSDNSGELEICDFRGTSHARFVIIDASGRPQISEVDAAGKPPSC